MEKKYSVIIVIITLVSLIFSIFTTDNIITKRFNISSVDNDIDNVYFEIKDGFYQSKYGKISIEKWELIDVTNSGFDDAKDFLNTVDNYVLSISDYIGMNNWIDLHKAKYRKDYYFEPVIDFAFIENDEGMSYAEHYLKLRIKLNTENFENNFSTLAREITHIITGESTSPSLSEGLGFYIQDEIGVNLNKFTYGIDIFTCSKDYISEKYKSTIEKIGEPFGNVTISDRVPFYILSNSFCRYLIEKHGIEKFMKVYTAEDIEVAYNEVYDLTSEELKSLWIKYVQDYDDYIKISQKYTTDKYKKDIKLIGTINDIDEKGGSIKNKAFFTLNKSFTEYLKKEFGMDMYDKLVNSNFDYHNVYEKSVVELRNQWFEYIKGLK